MERVFSYNVLFVAFDYMLLFSIVYILPNDSPSTSPTPTNAEENTKDNRRRQGGKDILLGLLSEGNDGLLFRNQNVLVFKTKMQ